MGATVNRKEAIRAYKELKPARGAYAMRCAASGQVWVGSSMNLDATRNGLWFGLRHGSYIDKTLQAAWDAHGEPEFSYEILEKFDDDVCPIELKDLLKARRAHWAEKFGARKLL
jgi:hypothetical protein